MLEVRQQRYPSMVSQGLFSFSDRLFTGNLTCNHRWPAIEHVIFSFAQFDETVSLRNLVFVRGETS